MKFQPFNLLRKFLPGEDVRDLGRILAICCLVGVVAGLGAIGFYWLLGLAKYVFLDCLAGYHPVGPGGEPPPFPSTDVPLNRWILLLVLPASGGLVRGGIVCLLPPGPDEERNPAAVERLCGVPVLGSVASSAENIAPLLLDLGFEGGTS